MAQALCTPILIVEDNADTRDVLQRMLHISGYDAVTVADGVDALAYLRGGGRPTAIVMDFAMPRMDGFALRRALSADPNWASAYTGLGVAERKLNNFDGAIKSWKRAVELDPREFDAMYNLATELASAGRTAEARAYAEQFVGTAPPARYGDDIRRLRAYLAKP